MKEMSKPPNEQVLTLTDLKILHLLMERNRPVKMGEISSHLKKYPQRTKDRIIRLSGLFIQESQIPHSKREKPFEIIPSEKEFVSKVLSKFDRRINSRNAQ